GYFSPFPHGTDPLSVTRKYLALPGGPGRFTQDFTGPVLLGRSPHTAGSCFVYGTLTHSGHASQRVRLQPHEPCPSHAEERRMSPQHRACNTSTLDTHTV